MGENIKVSIPGLSFPSGVTTEWQAQFNREAQRTRDYLESQFEIAEARGEGWLEILDGLVEDRSWADKLPRDEAMAYQRRLAVLVLVINPENLSEEFEMFKDCGKLIDFRYDVINAVQAVTDRYFQGETHV